MLRFAMLATLPLCLAFVPSPVIAQVILPGTQGPVVMPGQVFPGQVVPGQVMPGQVMPGQVVPGQVIPGQVFPGQVFPGTVTPGNVVQGQINYPAGTIIYPNGQVVWPQSYNAMRPSVPSVVTPNQITSINPQTGGLNTTNQQLNNTVWDPGRNISQFNNTRRWVRRPVYNTRGQISGYQQGWVWNNSFTGQEHGNLQSYTPNQFGGVHEGGVAYSRSDQ
ncbi:MAG: hypothetical protein HKN47_26010 [Pirellulaceae bacterium]|nr:hypothetical protein [Pirellulaceae bacterium]